MLSKADEETEKIFKVKAKVLGASGASEYFTFIPSPGGVFRVRLSLRIPFLHTMLPCVFSTRIRVLHSSRGAVHPMEALLDPPGRHVFEVPSSVHFAIIPKLEKLTIISLLYL